MASAGGSRWCASSAARAGPRAPARAEVRAHSWSAAATAGDLAAAAFEVRVTAATSAYGYEIFWERGVT